MHEPLPVYLLYRFVSTVIPEKNDPGVGWGWGGGGVESLRTLATRTFSRASREHILTRLAGLALLVSLVAARGCSRGAREPDSPLACLLHARQGAALARRLQA